MKSRNPDEPGEREYEFRTETGKVHARGFARNACVFRLKMLANGTSYEVGISSGPNGSSSLSLFVVATGERVRTEIAAGPKCRLANDDAARWFKGDGHVA